MKRPANAATAALWWLRLRNGQSVFLLLEFQSSPDRAMALRMLAYATLLAQGVVRRGEARARGRLPPVLPVVLYNGTRRWRASPEVAELYAAAPPAIEALVPRQRFLLVDVERLPDPAEGDLSNLAALLFRLERSRTAAEAAARADALRRGLARAASSELRRAFGTWFLRASRGRRHLEQLGEEETMFEKALALWKEELLSEGRHEGRVEGRVEGEMKGQVEGQVKLLQRQLAFKFGPLDAATRERVSTATPDQLALWAERLLIASSLAEVFAAH